MRGCRGGRPSSPMPQLDLDPILHGLHSMHHKIYYFNTVCHKLGYGQTHLLFFYYYLRAYYYVRPATVINIDVCVRINIRAKPGASATIHYSKFNCYSPIRFPRVFVAHFLWEYRFYFDA